jgi:hypothetical protein
LFLAGSLVFALLRVNVAASSHSDTVFRMKIYQQ